MKRVVATILLGLVMFGGGGLRAADLNGNLSSAYNGSLAGGMMGAMWDFMEWFLGRRHNGGYGGWDGPGGYPSRPGAFNNPYRDRDYWDDPANPWVDMRTLDGVWLAQTGEYWYVRGNRFVLVDSHQQQSPGEFRVEGNFILTRMPGGEVEFEFRQMDDVLLLRDVSGRLMLLRRIEAGGWRW